MEFLRSLLRRRFARAQVATSRNVGCFLRLDVFQLTELVLNRRNVSSLIKNLLNVERVTGGEMRILESLVWA